MNKREDYERLLSNLKYSQNEEEVITNITKIVKFFSPSIYKFDLYQNSYFKSIVLEIKEELIDELNEIYLNLNYEMEGIDNELVSLNSKGITNIKHPDISKLRDIKRECILLIKELKTRIEELNSL